MDEKFLERAEELTYENTRIMIERAGTLSKKPDGFIGDCGECGNKIPPARVLLGYYICVECQTAEEKSRRFYRP